VVDESKAEGGSEKEVEEMPARELKERRELGDAKLIV
jgi:hypothetical protein